MSVPTSWPHLPECTLPKGHGDCICDELSGAYARGRIDALNAAIGAITSMVDMYDGLRRPGVQALWTFREELKELRDA